MFLCLNEIVVGADIHV